MSTFKKLKLVSEDELQRLKEKQIRDYDPKIKKLAFLQSEMDLLLNEDSGLNTEERLKLFQAAQQRFESFKAPSLDNLPVVKKTVTEHEVEEALEGVQPFVDLEDDEDSVLGLVPAQLRTKAKGLLNLITTNPDLISFDSHNNVSISGTPIQGANFTDLFRSMYVHRKGEVPGQAKFLRALKDMNVPISLISNTRVHSQLGSARGRSLSRSPKAFKTPITSPVRAPLAPPGKQPTVLHVYPPASKR